MNYIIMSNTEYFVKCSDKCIFNKNVKNSKKRERIVSSTKDIGKIGIHMQKSEVGSLCHTQKRNSHGIYS